MKSGVRMPLGAVVILLYSCLILQASNYAEAEIGGRHIRRITAADLPSSNSTDATKVRLKKLQIRNGENCTTEPCSKSSTSAPPTTTATTAITAATTTSSISKEETRKSISYVADDVLQKGLHHDVLSHLTTTSSPYASGYSYFDDIGLSDGFGEETSHETKSSVFNDDNHSGTEASNFGATLTTPRISLFDDIHAIMTESIRQNLEDLGEHRFRDISRPHSERSLKEQQSESVVIHKAIPDVAKEISNESIAFEFKSNLSVVYNNSESPSSVKKDLMVENGTHMELEKSLVHTKIHPEVNRTVFYISNDTHSTVIPKIESVLTKGSKDSLNELKTSKSSTPAKLSTTSESPINSSEQKTIVTSERSDKSTSRDSSERSLTAASTNAVQNKTGTPGDKDSTTSDPTRGRSYSRSQENINSLNKGDLTTSSTKQIEGNSKLNSSDSVSTKDPDSNAVAPVSIRTPTQISNNNRGSRMLESRRGQYNTTSGQDQSSHSPISGSSENRFAEDSTKKPKVRYSTRRTGTSRSEEQTETSTVSFGTTTEYAPDAKTETTEVPEDNVVLSQTIQNSTVIKNYKNSPVDDEETSETTEEPEESSTLGYTSSRGRAFSYRHPYTTARSTARGSETTNRTDDSGETSTTRPSASSVNMEAIKRRLTTMRRRQQLTTEASVTLISTSNSTTESNVIFRGWPTVARRPSVEGKVLTNISNNTENNEGNDIISVKANVYKAVTRNRGTVRYGSQRNDTSVFNQRNDTSAFPIPPTAAAWSLVTLKGPGNETRPVRHPVQGNNSTNSSRQTTAGRWPSTRNRRPWTTILPESSTTSSEATRGSFSTSPKSTKLSAVPEEKQATRMRTSIPQKKIQQSSMQENRLSTIQVLAPTTEQELEQTTGNVLFSTTENDVDTTTALSLQITTSSDELTTSADLSFQTTYPTSMRGNSNMVATATNTSDMVTSGITSSLFLSSASYVTTTMPTTSTDDAVTLTTQSVDSTTDSSQSGNIEIDNETTESSLQMRVTTEGEISLSTNSAEDISTTTTENSSQGVTTLPGPFITAGSPAVFMEDEINNPPQKGEGDQQPESPEGDTGNNVEAYQGIVNAEEANSQGDESKQGVGNAEGSQQEEGNRPVTGEETRGDAINSEGSHVQGDISLGSSDEEENKNADGNRQSDDNQNSGKQPPASAGGDEPFPAQEEPADYGGPDSAALDHNADGVTAAPSRTQTAVPETLTTGTKSIEFETIATPRSEQTTTWSSSTSAIEWGADSTTLPSVTNVPFYLILTVMASWSSFCDREDEFKQAVIDLMRKNQRPIASYQVMLPSADLNCPNAASSPKTATQPSIDVEMYLVDGGINFDRQLTMDFYDFWRTSGLPSFPLEVTMQPAGQTSDGGDDDGGGGGGMIAAITISCIGAVCLLLLVVLWLVMRKRQQRFSYGQRCTPVSLDAYSLDSVSVCGSVRRKGVVRNSKRSYGNAGFEDPSTPSHPMGFAGLANFVLNREAMEEEFANIPQVTANVDEIPQGADTKNRYSNVIPLPETRVQLAPIEGEPLSEYINANYVHGPKNASKYYIACQAPLTSTVQDFWRMIWEQQSKVILMLTDLVENGVEKSADYLPPSEVLDCHRLFGDFQITLKKREVKEKYIISTLQLKNLETNSWREVMHLWYVSWPAQGVPDDASSVIAFLLEARPYMRGGPCVVHCSPGTGRTGTALACDLCIRDFETTRIVDIPRCVARLRRDRAGAVQTRDQYVFTYQVVNLYGAKLTGGALDSM